VRRAPTMSRVSLPSRVDATERRRPRERWLARSSERASTLRHGFRATTSCSKMSSAPRASRCRSARRPATPRKRPTRQRPGPETFSAPDRCPSSRHPQCAQHRSHASVDRRSEAHFMGPTTPRDELGRSVHRIRRADRASRRTTSARLAALGQRFALASIVRFELDRAEAIALESMTRERRQRTDRRTSTSRRSSGTSTSSSRSILRPASRWTRRVRVRYQRAIPEESPHVFGSVGKKAHVHRKAG
jgi:hypothetical protein